MGSLSPDARGLDCAMAHWRLEQNNKFKILVQPPRAGFLLNLILLGEIMNYLHMECADKPFNIRRTSFRIFLEVELQG